MEQPKRAYNSKVLIGNWFNKNCEDEHKLAMYIKRKERRDLLILRFRVLFDNFLKPVPRHLASKGLRYGGTVQLFCPDAKSAPPYSTEYSDRGLVLAVTIDPNEIEQVQSIFEDSDVVGSPLKQPCVRNSFIIESDEGKRNEEPICYGDTFYLRSVEATEFPLYIEVCVPSLGAAVGKCGNPTAKLRIFRSSDARFRICHLNPSARNLSDGTVLPPTDNFYIFHGPNNSSLFIEDDVWKMSLFSYECEISTRRIGEFTKWQFIMVE